MIKRSAAKGTVRVKSTSSVVPVREIMGGAMQAFKLSYLIAGSLLVAAASKPVQGVGFTCEGPNGAVKRLNIDLKANRYQEAGKARTKIQAVDEASVTLLRYSTLRDGFYLLHRLDRSTLALTVDLDRGHGPTSVTYQCRKGPPFDFAAERQF